MLLWIKCYDLSKEASDLLFILLSTVSFLSFLSLVLYLLQSLDIEVWVLIVHIMRKDSLNLLLNFLLRCCEEISQLSAILARISSSLEQKTLSIAIKSFDHSLNSLLIEAEGRAVSVSLRGSSDQLSFSLIKQIQSFLSSTSKNQDIPYWLDLKELRDRFKELNLAHNSKNWALQNKISKNWGNPADIKELREQITQQIKELRIIYWIRRNELILLLTTLLSDFTLLALSLYSLHLLWHHCEQWLNRVRKSVKRLVSCLLY